MSNADVRRLLFALLSRLPSARNRLNCHTVFNFVTPLKRESSSTSMSVTPVSLKPSWNDEFQNAWADVLRQGV